MLRSLIPSVVLLVFSIHLSANPKKNSFDPQSVEVSLYSIQNLEKGYQKSVKQAIQYFVKTLPLKPGEMLSNMEKERSRLKETRENRIKQAAGDSKKLNKLFAQYYKSIALLMVREDIKESIHAYEDFIVKRVNMRTEFFEKIESAEEFNHLLNHRMPIDLHSNYHMRQMEKLKIFMLQLRQEFLEKKRMTQIVKGKYSGISGSFQKLKDKIQSKSRAQA